MIRHVMHTYRTKYGAMAWYGEERKKEREREGGRWGQTSCLLQSSERAAPGRLPPSGGWGRARLPSSACIASFSIYFISIYLPSFLVGRAVSFSPSSSSLFSFF